MATEDTNAEHDLVERNDAIKFAHRTRHNLEVIEQQATAGASVHAVTQLVNSLLGLLVFIKEQKFNNEIRGLTLASLEAQGWPQWRSSMDTPTSLGQLVRHLRNAVAHGGIKFSSDAAALDDVSFEFTDRDPKSSQITWQGQISGPDLRRFVLRLVQEVDQRIG